MLVFGGVSTGQNGCNPWGFSVLTVFDVWQVCMKKSYTWWMPPARCEKLAKWDLIHAQFGSSKEGTWRDPGHFLPYFFSYLSFFCVHTSIFLYVCPCDLVPFPCLFLMFVPFPTLFWSPHFNLPGAHAACGSGRWCRAHLCHWPPRFECLHQSQAGIAGALVTRKSEKNPLNHWFKWDEINVI